MCKFTTLALLVGIISGLACQPPDEAPDLVEISKDYCTNLQTCVPDDGLESQEACEEYSADEYERTRTENKPCYDARIVMETCLGAFESCDDFLAFWRGESEVCQMEFRETRSACMEP